MRTPAENYFGPEGFTELLEALTKFGQEKLGCTAISPPWLSVYVDGCEQRYHTDSWHGPWAFVLSLTGKNLRVCCLSQYYYLFFFCVSSYRVLVHPSRGVRRFSPLPFSRGEEALLSLCMPLAPSVGRPTPAVGSRLWLHPGTGGDMFLVCYLIDLAMAPSGLPSLLLKPCL